VRFLIDAQLPRSLCEVLSEFGCDCRHTRDLPRGNATADSEISSVVDSEERILISKDSDFVITHILSNSPRRLLLVSTGNIGNAALKELIRTHFQAIASAFDTARLVEVTAANLVVHRQPTWRSSGGSEAGISDF